MRKVSQSLQPKVGRLCTATKPSYPCHLWGETLSASGQGRRCQAALRGEGAWALGLPLDTPPP